MKPPLPKTRRYRLCIYFVCTLLVALAADLVWVRLWRHITVSPPITHITAPLKPDGTPDYIKYLDDRVREGITLENNAVIPFLQIVPEQGWCAPDVQTEWYASLGVPPPPVRKPLVQFSDIFRGKNPGVPYTNTDEEDYVRQNPWSPQEHPDAVAYLKANETALDILPQVVARQRWYVPLRPPKHVPAIGFLLPAYGIVRERCYELLTRAMLEIQQGQFAGARTDIMIVHRFARLVAGQPSIVEFLTGVGLERLALNADGALVSAAGLPREELSKFLTEWDALPAWPAMDNMLDGERLMDLELLVYASSHMDNVSFLVNLDGANNMPEWAGTLARRLRPAHFNLALRQVNEFYDRCAAAIRSASALEREDLLAAMDRDSTFRYRHSSGLLGDPARQLATLLVPSWLRVTEVSDIRQMEAGLTRVAIALTACKADNGSYPDALDALAPKYLAKIPEDIFSGTSLKYCKTEGGYLLYSVGLNRQDDGGTRYPQGNRKGDLVLQFPRPPKQ